MRRAPETYPPIDAYGFISDGHSVALVCHSGSIDWCCFGQIDATSSFGRLLDWERGGHCRISPESGEARVERHYVDGSLVLDTHFLCDEGEFRVRDAFAMREGGREDPHCHLLRQIEGVRGAVPVCVEISPRFDYGTLKPWVRCHGARLWTAIGGELGLVIASDLPLEIENRHDLCVRLELHAGDRRRLSIRSAPSHRLHPGEPPAVTPEEVDRSMEETIAWWRRWSGRAAADLPRGEQAVRSAIVLKGLTCAPTGAIAAAATTSLPEQLGGERNWDYRYSWVRDSSFALQSLVALGYEKEAIGFRYFLERATAGSVDELAVMYGVDGRHRLTEIELPELDGYRGSRPVRIGNDAHRQVQLDIYGDLIETAWRSARHGEPPGDDYWQFLVQVVEEACRRWRDPDHGIWEVRSEPEHFVHSKASCWSACHYALRIAEQFGLEGPLDRWRSERDEIRAAIDARGVDRDRGIFVRSFGSREVDGALLLLPRMGFVDWDDERMRRTVDVVREELDADGLIRRYRTDDGLHGKEGVFVACSFWLVECLASQRRWAEAEEVFERARAQANDLGLFAEQYAPRTRTMLGNFPQALSHYSHITALLALAEKGGRGA